MLITYFRYILFSLQRKQFIKKSQHFNDQEYSQYFLLVDERIREAQKLTDPDPEY